MKIFIHLLLLALLFEACNPSQKTAPDVKILRKPYPVMAVI